MGWIQLDVADTTRRVETDASGRFRFEGIADGMLAVLSVEGDALFPRGSVLRMTGDRWDADIVMLDSRTTGGG